jgi:hypothetical protein
MILALTGLQGRTNLGGGREHGSRVAGAQGLTQVLLARGKVAFRVREWARALTGLSVRTTLVAVPSWLVCLSFQPALERRAFRTNSGALFFNRSFEWSGSILVACGATRPLHRS